MKSKVLVKLMTKAVELSGNSILVTNAKGDIVFVNDSLLEHTGYSREELIGRNPRIFKSEHFPPDYYKEMWETLMSGKEWNGEFLNKRKDGTLYWEFARICPVCDDDGITYYVGVKENITRVKELEERLVELSQRIDQINTATHQLKKSCC
jgi:PAS domain S-box-containing protein